MYSFFVKNQIKNGTYLLVDLEMTGLNPFRNGVIEVGALVMDNRFDIIGEFFMDLCPPADIVIEPDALEYNGFTLDRIAAGRSYEEFCEAFQVFIDSYFSLDQNPIIVGQYVTADISFLQSIFYLAGYPQLFMRLGNDILDTKSIANEHNAIARYSGKPVTFESTSLSKPWWLTDRLKIRWYEAHTARWDVMATREVLMKFLRLDTLS